MSYKFFAWAAGVFTIIGLLSAGAIETGGLVVLIPFIVFPVALAFAITASKKCDKWEEEHGLRAYESKINK